MAVPTAIGERASAATGSSTASDQEHGSRFEEFTGFSVAQVVLIAIPALAAVVAALWLAVQFLDPPATRRSR